jgi:hypothetical protein
MTEMLSKIQIGGVHMTWQMIVAAIVAAQWAVVALVAVIAPVRARKALAISTVVFAAGWFLAFDAKAIKASTSSAEAATVAGAVRKGSCASIRNDMTMGEVRSRLGEPDETRSDEIVRGPGSTVLIYRDLRCAVHLFDSKVELVD